MVYSLKDRAKSKAAKLIKKNRLLTPFVYMVLVPLLFGIAIVNYFKNNGKRYLVMVMALVFFFMSASFSFPGNDIDSELYLSSTDGGNVNSDEVDVVKDDSIDFTEDVEWIEDSAIINAELEKELSVTDNVDLFSLDDFLKKSKVVTADSLEAEESTFDKDAWNLILVNKTHPVPADYEVPLIAFSGSMKCDERVLEPLTEMIAEAAKSNINLIVTSPYRDYTLQTTLFNRKINAYMGRGYSYMESYKLTCSNVTVPGASEHQIGMAFDFVTTNHKTLDNEFFDTPAGRWLYEHGKEFGFILRYPADKTDITGIMYEPWHYRYVGVEAATYIMDNGLTLEEFVEDLY